MDMILDDDDIYGDLESSIFHNAKNPTYRTRVELEAKNKQLESYLEQAQSQIKELTEKLKKSDRNYIILQRNAQCLQETARVELERKNGAIASLAKKLEDLSKRIKPSWNVEEKCPQITRADLNELGRVIQTAYSVAAEFKISQIKECLAEKRQRNMPKLSEKKSESITAHKISFENMHMYFYQEQCDFQRKEEVTFPQKFSSALPKAEEVTSVKVKLEDEPCEMMLYLDAQAKAVKVEKSGISLENRSLASPSLKEKRNEATSQPSNTSTPNSDQAPTQGSADAEVKSTTPDLTRGTAERVRPRERREDDEGRGRTSHSSPRHEYKRPRSYSKERVTRSGRPRYDVHDRRRAYEHSPRGHYYERRRHDMRRDPDRRDYKLTKPSH